MDEDCDQALNEVFYLVPGYIGARDKLNSVCSRVSPRHPLRKPPNFISIRVFPCCAGGWVSNQVPVFEEFAIHAQDRVGHLT